MVETLTREPPVLARPPLAGRGMKSVDSMSGAVLTGVEVGTPPMLIKAPASVTPVPPLQTVAPVRVSINCATAVALDPPVPAMVRVGATVTGAPGLVQ